MISTEPTVEDTNLESHQSKLSLINLGYRKDEYIKCFFGTKTKYRRSPSINLGYLARTIAIEESFEDIIIDLASQGQKFQVLSCGAGFDSAFFRLRSQGIIPDSCQYYEVDFPLVINRKKGFILNFPALQQCCFGGNDNKHLKTLNGNVRINNLHLISCDLTNTSELQSRLTEAGFNWDCVTVILSECSITYIDAHQASNFLMWVRLHIRNAIIIDYEQISPNDQFGKIMTRHFRNRQSTLKCIEHFPTIADHLKRFRHLGFEVISAMDLNEILMYHWNTSERKHISEASDDFDEPEELIQKCSHYMLLVATTAPDLKLRKRYQLDHKIPRPSVIHIPRALQYRTLQYNPHLERFGHRVVNVSGRTFLFGGCSPTTGRDNCLAELCTDTFQTLWRSELPDTRTLFSAVTTDLEHIFIHGGRSSPAKSSNALFSFCLSDNTVEPIACNGQRPEARWKHTLSSTHDSLVLVGGKNRNKVFADILVFSKVEKCWHVLGKLPNGLYSHSAVCWNGKVIVTGGLTCDNRINEGLIVIDLFNKPSISVKKLNVIPRFSHTSHVIESKLYLIGGVSYSEPGVAVIDLVTGEEREFKFMFDPHQYDLIHSHGSIVEGSKIIVIGGGGNCFSFGKQVNSNPLEIPISELF